MTKVLVRCFSEWLISGIVLLMATGICQARTINVPGEYSTIQAGIDAAVHGDTVLVASRTYSGTGNKNLDFRGKAITVQSSEGPANTVIDCQGSGRGVLFRSGEGADSRFSGFTIKNGYVNGLSLYGGKGGGIYCSNSSPTISDCVISYCRADGFGGGGIALYTSAARIEDTIIEHNSTETSGGGLLINDNSSPAVYNSIIRNNKTLGLSSGGGVCVIGSNPTISYCTISYNESNINYPYSVGKVTNSGGISFREGASGTMASSIISHNKAQERGGIGSWEATPTIINCLIENNEATVDGGGGLGFYQNSNAKISKSTIKNNTANEYGGGVSIWNETASGSGPLFTDCIIENNVAGDSSGGLNILDSSPEISRCIIRGNTASKRAGLGLKALNGTTSSVLVNNLVYNNTATTFGGGITCFSGAAATITNCTVVNNYSGSGSAGLYVDSANVSVANSILWGNSRDDLTSGATITYSDVSGGYVGVGNKNSDPLFTSTTDFHLLIGSPCINAGNNAASHLSSVDLGGNNRIYDTVVGMGAYEFPYVGGGPGVSGKIGAHIDPSADSIITPVLFLLLHTP